MVVQEFQQEKEKKCRKQIDLYKRIENSKARFEGSQMARGKPKIYRAHSQN